MTSRRRPIYNDQATDEGIRESIENNDLDSLKEVISLAPDKDVALIIASDNDRLEIAQYLLDNFDFTEEHPILHKNALDRALNNAASVEMARLLIEYGAEFTGDILLRAEYIGNLDLIEFYLEQGVDETLLNKVLRKVYDYGNTDFINLLIDYGASPVIAANYAAYSGALNTLSSILDSHYFDDDDFDNVIDMLIRLGYNDIAEVLILERTVKSELINEDSLLFNLPGPVLEGLMDNLRL